MLKIELEGETLHELRVKAVQTLELLDWMRAVQNTPVPSQGYVAENNYVPKPATNSGTTPAASAPAVSPMSPVAPPAPKDSPKIEVPRISEPETPAPKTRASKKSAGNGKAAKPQTPQEVEAEDPYKEIVVPTPRPDQHAVFAPLPPFEDLDDGAVIDLKAVVGGFLQEAWVNDNSRPAIRVLLGKHGVSNVGAAPPEAIYALVEDIQSCGGIPE